MGHTGIWGGYGCAINRCIGFRVLGSVFKAVRVWVSGLRV